jgi:hypothetical protein
VTSSERASLDPGLETEPVFEVMFEENNDR